MITYRTGSEAVCRFQPGRPGDAPEMCRATPCLPGRSTRPGLPWALQSSGWQVAGMQAVFTSDIPIGSGLSSSAALQVVFAAAWRLLGRWQLDCLELARLCLRAENDYVGVACGLMDQFASACGVKASPAVF